MKGFVVKRACELQPRPPERRWLVSELWADQAVGIVGGEPKCCKSFLALDLAVAVASGAPALRRFAVKRQGPVLLYAAEDALHVVRSRLDGICQVAARRFDALDVHVITAPTLRLDVDADRRRLRDAVGRIQPVLLVLDPFVRLHRIDENAAADVAPLLAFLRELQRRHHSAVLLVHHARKRAGNARAGQSLRGSSELHAWGDSNLYLRRDKQQLLLSVEHRAAASIADVALQLAGDGDAVALHIADRAAPQPPTSPAQRIEHILADKGPLSRRALRDICRIRASTVGDVLAELIADGRVIETDAGFALGEP